MAHEQEELLKKHYQVGKKLEKLRKKVERCEEEYNAIGKELESLNVSKEMLHRFRVTEDERLEKQADTVQDEEGFVEMDDHGGRIHKSFPRNLLGTGDNVLEIQPSKKRKIDVEADVDTGVPLSVTETETDVVFTLEMPGLHKEPSKSQSTDDEQPSTAHSELPAESDDTQDVVPVLQEQLSKPQSPVCVQSKGNQQPSTLNSESVCEPAPLTADANQVIVIEDDSLVGVKRTDGVVQLVKVVPEKTKEAIKKIPGSGRTDRQATGPLPKELHVDLTRHYCNKCPKHFKYLKGLAEHKEYRCGKTVKNFQCDICGEGFYYKNTMMDHRSAMDTKKIWYPCPYCEQGFYYPRDLSIHCEVVHQKK